MIAPGDIGSGALSGTQVLDLSEGVAGPFAARLLGDLGADVIKIEPPRRGDKARYFEPLAEDAPESERSLLFQCLNWNKRGITLDIGHPSARPLFQKLVSQSNIVIESFRPGQLAEWGLDYDQLTAWRPDLVLTSITSFGQTGPYAGYEGDDLIIQAMSGIMAFSGRQDLEPLKHGLQQSYFCAGLNGAYTSLAGLTLANRFGYGDHFDISIMEVVSSELVGVMPSYAFRGTIQLRPPEVKNAFQGDPLNTREGYLTMQRSSSAAFETFADFLEREEFRDPDMQNRSGSPETRALIEEVLQEHTAREWFDKGTSLRLVVGMVQRAKDLLECPQLEARDFFWDVEHPATGTFRFPAQIDRLSKTPLALRRRSPLLGEHTSEVICDELGFSHDHLRALRLAGIV
jgi:crotonobetainyl-CoA:carnitine CoA-transferase CaiB-like acyl-CoA transferase